MGKKVSFYVLLGIIVAFAVLAYQLMASFFVPMFLAVVLVIVFWPLHLRLVKLCKGRQRIAAALTTTAVLLIVLVPLVGIMTLAAAEGLAVVSRFDKDMVKAQLGKLRRTLGVETPYLKELRNIEDNFQSLKEHIETATPEAKSVAVAALITRIDRFERDLDKPENSAWRDPSASSAPLRSSLKTLVAADPKTEEYETALQDATLEFHDYRLKLLGGQYRAWLKELAYPTDEHLAGILEQAGGAVSGSLVKFTGQTGAVLANLILGLFIIVMAMFFFFADGPALNAAVMRAIPLDEDYKLELLGEFDRTSRAVVIATLLAAVVQGLLAGIGFYFAGLSSVFLLMLLSMVCALIPFVGAAIVWVPACLYLGVIEERLVPAVLLAVWCVAVVSSADNVVKPWVLHGQSKIHPLLALLSVLGGVQALGPIGILVGPMVVVFLQTLLKILQRELKTLEKQAATDSG